MLPSRVAPDRILSIRQGWLRGVEAALSGVGTSLSRWGCLPWQWSHGSTRCCSSGCEGRCLSAPQRPGLSSLKASPSILRLLMSCMQQRDCDSRKCCQRHDSPSGDILATLWERLMLPCIDCSKIASLQSRIPANAQLAYQRICSAFLFTRLLTYPPADEQPDRMQIMHKPCQIIGTQCRRSCKRMICMYLRFDKT